MKDKRNLRRLILFSLVAGCALGGLGSGDVYAAGEPPYEQILYIKGDDTVTQNDKDPSLQVDTSGLLKDGNFTYNTGDKLSKEKRGLVIMNSKKKSEFIYCSCYSWGRFVYDYGRLWKE